MSVNSKNIKGRLQSVKQTRKITNAMYLLSTARMKKELPQAEFRCEFAEKLKNSVYDLLSSEESKKLKSVYINPVENAPLAYLVITGDKGLCGSYNTDVIQKLKDEIKDKNEASFTVYGFGKTAGELIKNAGIEINEIFDGSASHPDFETAESITKKLIDEYISGRISGINIICNTLARKGKPVRLIKLLPLESREKTEKNEIIFEPDFETLFERVTESYCYGTVYSVLSLCALNENSARMNAMKAATDNADEMSEKLEREMNSQRQLEVTNEITEITAGRH